MTQFELYARFSIVARSGTSGAILQKLNACTR
ncbi:hypothetical protein SAMN05444746_12274 [Variovorax sp. OK212]|nr:hypothetical protein SAMN05518853_12274 [Variovorax sp. OK202]SFE36766.1 hypothetical protein SAMN05444746_12274 [Variovorax sp. OK212]